MKSVKHNGQALHYIEVIPQDIETANRLAHDALGRTLDELPPQSRTLLKRIHRMVTQACKQQGIEQSHYRFSRRDIRTFTGWSDGQLKIHCSRLTELEYLLVHRGGRGQSLVYELLYDGDPEQHNKHLMGLINPKNLGYDEKKSGQKAQKTAPSQGQVSPKSGASQGEKNGANTSATRVPQESLENPQENASLHEKPASYRTHTLAAER